MKRSIGQAMILGVVLLLVSCQEDSAERGSWVPAMEQTGFESLRDSGERIQAALQDSREKLAAGHDAEALASLADAENAGRILLYYDVPMTEVRQLIYDAGRLHALNRQAEARNHLVRAAEIALKIETSGSLSLQQAMQQLRAAMSALQMLLEDEQRATTAAAQLDLSRKVAAQFQELGHKVNLLVLKSDLVLSGADFARDIKGQ